MTTKNPTEGYSNEFDATLIHAAPYHQPQIVLTPIRMGIPATGGALDVLVRVQAPAKPEAIAGESGSASSTSRSPLRLSLVVDRSGSMDGQPLTEALRCVDHIAARLRPADQLAVVLYDHEVQVALPLSAAGDAEKVRSALAGIESGGRTDLHAGWEAGARELLLGIAGTISRVILLSDGQANQGQVDTAFIAGRCAYWAGRGVSTTTVGLGRGFNEDLMLAMAAAGGGQQYYGQTAEDLYDGFDEELALLEAMFLRKLRVKLIPGAGVVAEVLGQVLPLDDGRYALSDLAWAAESWLLVRLHVGAHANAGGAQQDLAGMDGKRALLSVTLEADDPLGASLLKHSDVLELDSLDASAWNDLPRDATVVRRLQEVDFAMSGAQVRGMLMSGDVTGARAKLAQMEVAAAGHPWLLDKLAKLKQLADDDAVMAAKELRYGSRKLSSRLAMVQEARYCMSETDNAELPAYLRRKASEGAGRTK